MLVIACRRDETVVIDLGNGERIEIRCGHSSPGKTKLIFSLPDSVFVSRVREKSTGRLSGNSVET